MVLVLVAGHRPRLLARPGPARWSQLRNWFPRVWPAHHLLLSREAERRLRAGGDLQDVLAARRRWRPVVLVGGYPAGSADAAALDGGRAPPWRPPL